LQLPPTGNKIRIMSSNLTIGFFGAGKMATALARGLIGAGLSAPDRIMAGDVVPEARSAFSKACGDCKTTSNNRELPAFAQVLILAVKPGQVREVLAEIKDLVTPGHLVISIAAGVTLGRMAEVLAPGSRVIRVMPNTPALVGAGAIAYALGDSATAEDAVLAQKLFAAVGLACQVKEALLDAVTGLSGSGPAYGFLAIEALSDGGVAAGLPRDLATKLAAQTLLGAAKMVLETGMHPGALKDMVTSPGGTTIEGVHELEKGGLRAAFMNAVRAASERSRQLSKSA
jgi:pyrroline-5-carboxylate reductase